MKLKSNYHFSPQRLLTITLFIGFVLGIWQLKGPKAPTTRTGPSTAAGAAAYWKFGGFEGNARRLLGLTPGHGRNIRNSELVRLLVNSYKPDAVCAVQVGANTGFALRPSSGRNEDDPMQAIVRSAGTRGMLIEPVPNNFEKLVRNAAPYSDRFLCVNAAISGSGNTSSMTFYAVAEKRVLAEFPAAPHWFLTQLGSFDKSKITNVVPYFRKVGTWNAREPSDYYVRSINVKVLSVSNILNMLKQRFGQCNKGINFLHVDAEGFDWVIVKHILTQARPDIIIFEEKHLPKDSIIEAQKLFRELNYYSWAQGQNRYAVKIGRHVTV